VHSSKSLNHSIVNPGGSLFCFKVSSLYRRPPQATALLPASVPQRSAFLLLHPALSEMDADMDERQIQARFVTKLKPPFKAPPTAITIPATVTRLGLSSIVNSLLQAGAPEWESEPFDFLIDGELVRMSLDQFLLAKGISAERTLEIEYIKAVVPRKEEEPSLHDDWVSAVDGSCSRFILTGCYDGLGRVWKAAGECTHILEGHTDAVTSVTVINPEGIIKQGDATLATASKDHTVRLWKMDSEGLKKSPAKIRPFKILRGHTASVQSVAAKTSGDMICSGSWDSTINLWQTNDSTEEDNSVSVKKRKTKNDTQDTQLEGAAVSTLVGHTQRVSAVVWPEANTIYSASWDHSVRRWDTDTGKAVFNIYCGKALNCLHVGGEGSALVAAGASDPVLRIWDPRKPETSAPAYQFSSHSSWISACQWHKKSPFHILSASYDGKVMLWDLRTAVLYPLLKFTYSQVLCADWWKGESVVSGGVDSKLRINSGISVL
ncbi:Ribosome biogenesis protein WDR12 homolog, partial [Linum perenne]